MSPILENPREVVSDMILAIIARVLAESHGVPDSILIFDDGFSPQGREIVRDARTALRHIIELAPYFGLQVQPSHRMLPDDPSLSKSQRALLAAIIAD